MEIVGAIFHLILLGAAFIVAVPLAVLIIWLLWQVAWWLFAGAVTLLYSPVYLIEYLKHRRRAEREGDN